VAGRATSQTPRDKTRIVGCRTVGQRYRCARWSHHFFVRIVVIVCPVLRLAVAAFALILAGFPPHPANSSMRASLPNPVADPARIGKRIAILAISTVVSFAIPKRFSGFVAAI
jgi:hypothetical protein